MSPLTRRELLVDGARVSVLGAVSSLLPPAAGALSQSGNSTGTYPPGVVNSGDAYVHFDAATQLWSCGTNLIEQRLQLTEGRFLLAGLTNRLTGTDFAARDNSDEFRFVFAGMERSGRTGGYNLKNYRVSRMDVPMASPGIDPGLTLEIDLEHADFLVSLHYDVYASTPRTPLGMIRKWYTVTNTTAQTQPLTEISMNYLRVRDELADRLVLHYWQGGGAQQGTNEMKIEPLSQQHQRTFCSMAGAPGYRVDDVYSGTASFHPYFVFDDPKVEEGLFIGFNYLGPWSARVWNTMPYPGRNGFLVSTQLDLHTEPLAPGAAFEAPNSFIGVYKGDLDSAGEQLQDWQATFKWDYTREDYLWTGTIYDGYWDDLAYRQRTDLHSKEMWRIADLCRRTGVRIAHEDDFWFDKRGRGVWEGIEWGELVSYLGQSGIHFKLWMPPQHFAPGTPPDVDHPDWALAPKIPDGIVGWYGLGFCVAAPGAHQYMKNFILAREKRYGAFYYRLDGWIQAPCWSRIHDHPPGQPHVQQYRHFLNLLREVKLANPGMGLQGCNSGGEWANWDKIELLENNQESDGGGPDDLYYLSYFWPVAKMMVGPSGASNHLDEHAQDRLRRDMLVWRYLRQENVVSRFMRVYHPRAEGAPNSYNYLQITDAGRTKAAIYQHALPQGEVVVYPKQLVPDLMYSVAFLFGTAMRRSTGADLMKNGIRFRASNANEIILLNLDNTPGRGTDRTPPTAPATAGKRTESWNGRAGVALRWTPSQDNVLLAGYQIVRDGKLIDYVGTGTFYFDGTDGNGIGHRYEIVAVDGDGNQSPATRSTINSSSVSS